LTGINEACISWTVTCIQIANRVATSHIPGLTRTRTAIIIPFTGLK